MDLADDLLAGEAVAPIHHVFQSKRYRGQGGGQIGQIGHLQGAGNNGVVRDVEGRRIEDGLQGAFSGGVVLALPPNIEVGYLSENSDNTYKQQIIDKERKIRPRWPTGSTRYPKSHPALGIHANARSLIQNVLTERKYRRSNGAVY